MKNRRVFFYGKLMRYVMHFVVLWTMVARTVYRRHLRKKSDLPDDGECWLQICYLLLFVFSLSLYWRTQMRRQSLS